MSYLLNPKLLSFAGDQGVLKSDAHISYIRWSLLRLQRGGCRSARVAVPWPHLLGELSA